MTIHKHIQKWCIASGLIVLLGLCSPVFGAVYYVDSGVTDTYVSGATPDFTTYNPTTFATDTGTDSVYKTIADVNAKSFSPGDFVYFRKGQTWSEQLTIPSSGNAGNPITFGAYGEGAAPIIDGTQYCIYGSDKDYITIENLDLTGFTDSGIYNLDGTNWTISNNNVHDGGDGSAPNHGIRVNSTAALLTGITVSNNTIGTIGTAENDAVGFNGILIQGVDTATISHNTINTTYVPGLRVIAAVGPPDNTDVIVENNELSGCYGGILVSNTDAAIIRYNYCHNGKGSGIYVSYDSDYAQIYYNIVHTMGSTTNLWNGIDVNHDSQNGSIYNNLVYGVHNHCMTIENDTAACNGWTVKNNIFDASANTGCAVPLKYWGLTTITSDNNDLIPLSSTKDYGSNLISNPSMEIFTGTQDDGISDNWDNWTEGSGTSAIYEAATNADAYLATRNIPAGTYCAKLTRGSAGANAMTITVSVVSMTPYEIRYKGLANTGGSARVALYIGSSYLQNDGSWSTTANWGLTGLAISSGDTSWTQKTLRFIPTVTGTMTIRLENYGAATTIIYADDWEIYRQGNVVANYSPGTINYRPYAFTEYKTTSSQDASSISSDPVFVNAAGGAFQLQATSPCKDAGVNVGLTTDYAGNPVGPAPDIGAYEYYSLGVTTGGGSHSISVGGGNKTMTVIN